MISSENFIRDINITLNQFISENFDCYVAFEYNTVQRIFNDINDGKTDNKPVFHLAITGNNEGVRETVGTDEEGNKIEGRKNFFEYTIYIVINNTYESNRGRKMILDGLVDNLKYSFDTEGDNLPFYQVKLSPMTTELMGENADNLYAVENILEFWLYRKF